jgi:hypothetical protein
MFLPMDRPLPLAALIIFATTIVLAGTNQQPHYHIDGTGTRTLRDLRGAENECYNYVYSVDVDGCNYRILVEYPTTTNTKIGLPRYEWTYNGKYALLSVSYPDPPSDEPLGLDGQSRITCNGFIGNGPTPSPSSAANGSLLWLVYASSCVVKEYASTERIRPPWQMEYSGLWESGITLPAKVSISHLPPDLPTLIVIFNDGRSRFLQRDNNRPAEVEAPAPFSKGYTNAVIEVLSTTNMPNGMSFPLSVSFKRFFPNLSGGKSAQDILLVETEQINTKHITFDRELLPETPTLKARAMLHERRPADRIHDFSLGYGIATNGAWRILDESALKLLESEAKKQNATSAVNTKTYRFRSTAFSIGICLLIVAGYFLNTRLKAIVKK